MLVVEILIGVVGALAVAGFAVVARVVSRHGRDLYGLAQRVARIEGERRRDG